jgi:hypothetical protein
LAASVEVSLNLLVPTDWLFGAGESLNMPADLETLAVESLSFWILMPATCPIMSFTSLSSLKVRFCSAARELIARV